MPERRLYPRFIAWLPLRLKAVAGRRDPDPLVLLTQNISQAGVCFRAPRKIEPNQLVEIEVTLLGVGPGGANIPIVIEGRIVRAEPGNRPGWYKLAAAFEDTSSRGKPDWRTLVSAFEDPSQ
jgi:hypothetical protein